MSSSSDSPPRTPPPSSPIVRVTLPTPPSFSQRKRSHSTSPPDQRSPPLPVKSNNPIVIKHEAEWKKTHGRSVSFNLPDILSPISPRDTSRNNSINADKNFTATEDGSISPGLYRIPQRSSDYISSPTFSSLGPISSPLSAPMESSEKNRRGPPRPLSLSPASQRFVGSGTGISPTTRLGPLTAPIHGTNGTSASSRWSSTAAARGLSIAPSLAKQRHSLAGTGGSIWSANLGNLGAASGWISPALGSARSVGGTSRTRGLTVAVMNHGKEILLETLPTPGLGGSFPRTPPATVREENESEMEGMEVLRNDLASPDPVIMAVSPALSSGKVDKKPKEIILCRYYHTSGLTCTSRPCRFVHDLATIGLIDASISDYDMKSPTTANLPSTALSPRAKSDGSPDFTSGTFAAFQAEARMKTLSIVGAEEKGIIPGEKVVVSSDNGTEVEGMVFLMSGGGKGPAGRGKAKFKTVKCKDYSEGHCAYGEYCSFIHDERPSEDISAPPKSAMPILSPSATRQGGIVLGEKTSKADRRKSFDPAALPHGAVNAWRHIPNSIKPAVDLSMSAVHMDRTGLSAFAAPFLEHPVKVDQTGQLIPNTSAIPPVISLEVTPSIERPHIKLDPPPMARTKSSDSSTSTSTLIKKSAWSKGPPGNIKTVTIDKTPPVVYHLTVPVSATSMFGTESDPATPWDPAIRAEKLALSRIQSNDGQSDQFDLDHSEIGERNPEYPPTATYVDIIPDYEYGTYSTNPSFGHESANPIQTQGVSYAFNSPAYPWGMPMSPINPNVQAGTGYAPTPKIPGGLGVMWSPSGWAVQDSAMKMALFQAENGSMGQGNKFKPKSYWRTRKCVYFAKGNCPHGDACTYIHELPDASDDLNPNPLVDKRRNTQPCKFFNSGNGCHNTSCAFLHTLVVPDSVTLVDKPRPWRTKPCRHYQFNRCHLGDACHFAHVYEDGHGHGYGANGDMEGEYRRDSFEERRRVYKRGEGEDDSDDDDIEIVTQDSTFSHPRTIRV